MMFLLYGCTALAFAGLFLLAVKLALWTVGSNAHRAIRF